MTEAIQERLRALPKETTFLCHWKERTKVFGEYYSDQNKRQPIENVQNKRNQPPTNPCHGCFSAIC